MATTTPVEAPFADRGEYRGCVEQSLPSWAARFHKECRPWGKREHHDERLGYRTEFQMDRDDILYSPSFRQLAYKRQMFSSKEVESFYTRLTHTLIVSQIGRSIARALRLDEHLVEAIALGHDLGHTPFGHAGEDGVNLFLDKRLFPELCAQLGMSEVADIAIGERIEKEHSIRRKPRQGPRRAPEGRQAAMFPSLPEVPSAEKLEQLFYCLPSSKRVFTHSSQSYRLLRHLEKGGRGLQLTLYTYYGVVRTSMSTRDDDQYALTSEGLSTDFASFEAQVVRLADDIAWANHDLTEDCRKTGVTPEALLRMYHKRTGNDGLRGHYDDLSEFLHAPPGERYGRFVTDVIETNKSLLTPRGYLSQENGKSGYVIELGPGMRSRLEDMKSIVVSTIHQSSDVKAISEKSVSYVEELCEFLEKPENFENHIPSSLRLGEKAERLPLLERLRAIVDYVAWMTDAEANSFHERYQGAFRAPLPRPEQDTHVTWPLD